MKCLSFCLIPSILFLLILLSPIASAHPGKTDAQGGHYDRATGEYHFHHGYPAHQHENGICPYDFDNKTGENSGSSSGSQSSSTRETVPYTEPTTGMETTRPTLPAPSTYVSQQTKVHEEPRKTTVFPFIFFMILTVAVISSVVYHKREKQKRLLKAQAIEEEEEKKVILKKKAEKEAELKRQRQQLHDEFISQRAKEYSVTLIRWMEEERALLAEIGRSDVADRLDFQQKPAEEWIPQIKTALDAENKFTTLIVLDYISRRAAWEEIGKKLTETLRCPSYIQIEPDFSITVFNATVSRPYGNVTAYVGSYTPYARVHMKSGCKSAYNPVNLLEEIRTREICGICGRSYSSADVRWYRQFVQYLVIMERYQQEFFTALNVAPYYRTPRYPSKKIVFHFQPKELTLFDLVEDSKS